MRFDSLSEWLAWQETLHFTEVDPGLARIGEVWQRLRNKAKLPFTVITVAGTNGKGSSVALLDSILSAAGYKTGTYTSPHLLRYNERICVAGQPCSDNDICQTFERIDQVRQDVSLTYFEFATLAAIDIFCQQDVDIVILEVGMGGRLDAVNLFDADIALITPISLDHTAWLGNDREQISAEKAGIIRAEQAVVCSESTPAATVLDKAARLNANCFIAEQAYFSDIQASIWHWHNADYNWKNLPLPALVGNYQLQNAAAVLQVIALLKQYNFQIDLTAIKYGLQHVSLAGRFQVIEGTVKRILDVTHNHQGACNLADLLGELSDKVQTHAVLAMLKDKDIDAVIAPLKSVINKWYIAGLDGSRGMTAAALTEKVATIVGSQKTINCLTVKQAYQQAMVDSEQDDRVLIFGSFHTVEAAMRLIPECLDKEKL
ncbi:bifunctional folylpolyglutamate synthase/dihydrofolate synthase [Methylophaga sp. 41_12_T18]|nr:bifunctional folylpolyglutamate synthase/dihydrofolate synthase [Methylophaga sp. 41_12_T18]